MRELNGNVRETHTLTIGRRLHSLAEQGAVSGVMSVHVKDTSRRPVFYTVAAARCEYGAELKRITRHLLGAC